MRKRVYLLLAFIWMGVIFYMSNQPASVSSQHSGGVIEFLSNLPFVGSIVTYMMEIDIAEFIIRKGAHMFSYFLLAILLFMSIYDNKRNLSKVSLQSLIFTFLYACIDEFHQLFITGRSGEFRDVLIDTIGGSIGVCIIYLCFKINLTHFKQKNIYK